MFKETQSMRWKEYYVIAIYGCFLRNYVRLSLEDFISRGGKFQNFGLSMKIELICEYRNGNLFYFEYYSCKYFPNLQTNG